MSGATITIQLQNGDVFARALEKTRAAWGNLQVPFTAIAADFYKSEESIFKRTDPGPYPDLTDPYGRYKEKRVGFRYPILVLSGALAASITTPDASDSIYNVGPQGVAIGTAVRYGLKQQATRPFVFIGPDSPFADAAQQERPVRWAKILEDYMREAFPHE